VSIPAFRNANRALSRFGRFFHSGFSRQQQTICFNERLPPVSRPTKSLHVVTPEILHFVLERHRASDPSPLDSIEADLTRVTPLQSAFRFRGVGDVAGVHFPAPSASSRRDSLWRHTCFEVFIAVPGSGYYEFNFAPSSQWAAYRFDSYRQGMTEQVLSTCPHVTFAPGARSFVLEATVDLRGLLEESMYRHAPRIGLAAVIEDANRRLSYWALTHPSGKPDFHHPDGFIATLPDNCG